MGGKRKRLPRSSSRSGSTPGRDKDRRLEPSRRIGPSSTPSKVAPTPEETKRARGVGLYILGLVLLVGGALRVWLSLNDDGVFWPDEIFQSLEPAHRVVFGYGLVAWEFVQGARNWTFAGFVAALFEIARSFGSDDSRAYLWLTRLTFSAISVATAFGVYRLARSHGAATVAAACGAALFALAAPMVYFAPRAMSETASALPVVFGFSFASPAQASIRARVLGASLLGLSVLLRLQNGIFCVGLLVILAARRDFRALGQAALTLGIWAVLFGTLDRLTWGEWFQSAIVYARVNLSPEVERVMGAASFDYYAHVLWTSMPAAAVFMVCLSVAAVRRAPGLLATTVAFALAHSAFPHKEFRFLLPAIPLFCGLAAIGLDEIQRFSERWISPDRALDLKWVAPTLSVALLASAGLSAADFHSLTFRDIGQFNARATASAYDHPGSVNRLLLLAGRQADLCGVKVETAGLEVTGGYSFLHRPVPMYPPSGPPRDSGYFNYVIAARDPAPAGDVRAVDGPVALVRLGQKCLVDARFDWRLPLGVTMSIPGGQ
jgi:GPI mannosyltransferase 3